MQTTIETHRARLQEIGSAVCSDVWSKYDQPEYPKPTS